MYFVMNIVIPGLHWNPDDPCIKIIRDWLGTPSLTIDPKKGISQNWYGEYGNIESHMDSFRGFIETHSIDNPTIIGHSLWALTAIVYASQNRVDGLMLINPQMGGKYDIRASRKNYRESTKNWKKQWFQVRTDQEWNTYRLPWDEYWEKSFRFEAVSLAKMITSRVVVIVWQDDLYINKDAIDLFLGNLNTQEYLLLDIEGPHVAKTQKELEILHSSVQQGISYLNS